jgi:hypothetical protein
LTTSTHFELISKSLDSSEESPVADHSVFARNDMRRQTADNMRTNPLPPIITDCLFADWHCPFVPNMDSTLAQCSSSERDANPITWYILVEMVCVSFTRTALRKCGIHVRDERAMPVGEKAVSDDWGEWVCPHVIGGLPTHIITREYAMIRDGTFFTGIKGL